MGQAGSSPERPRHGIDNLWGESIASDPRSLTSYVRDISLVSDAEYRQLRAPTLLEEFPSALGNADLEYSGIYEDGWVGK